MAKKGENIYRRKDGRWEGRCILERKENGRYRYEYVYGGTYQEVKEKLILKKSARLLARPENEKAEMRREKPGRFSSIAKGWLETVRHQVRESTYIKYRNLADSYILPRLGELEWDDITRETLESFCGYLRTSGGRCGKGLSSKTLADTMSVIRSIFRYAAGHGASLSFDPSSLFIRNEPPTLRILSRKEQETLCRFLCADLNGRNLGVLICMFTGMRLGEICALRWEDISFYEQTIYVHRTMQRLQTCERSSAARTRLVITAPKSRDSIRQIPIPAE